MNIITRPYGSDLCCCRPDTTWERENKDFYSPECVNAIFRAPVVFARISKAGKCIGSRFAERYYDGFNFGVLLYCSTAEEMTPADIAYASCIDHTSLLPMPLYNPVLITNEDNFFEISADGKKIYGCHCGEDIKSIIEDTICRASQLTSLRIGDFVAAELEMLEILARRSDDSISLEATFCENEIISNRIIF